MSEYVPPVEFARSRLAKWRSGALKADHVVVESWERVEKLESTLVEDLVNERAPFRVARWVAWTSRPAARRQRCDLVIHLRHIIHTPKGGWLLEKHFRLALNAWRRAIDAARKRGLIQPRVHEVPTEAYEAAIAGSKPPKKKRSSAARKGPLTLTKEERAALESLPVLEGLLKRISTEGTNEEDVPEESHP